MEKLHSANIFQNKYSYVNIRQDWFLRSIKPEKGTFHKDKIINLPGRCNYSRFGKTDIMTLKYVNIKLTEHV